MDHENSFLFVCCATQTIQLTRRHRTKPENASFRCPRVLMNVVDMKGRGKRSSGIGRIPPHVLFFQPPCLYPVSILSLYKLEYGCYLRDSISRAVAQTSIPLPGSRYVSSLHSPVVTGSQSAVQKTFLEAVDPRTMYLLPCSAVSCPVPNYRAPGIGT